MKVNIKNILVFIVLLGFIISAKAQNGSISVGFQSPTAASLGKYGDTPVSFYTGSPNINIPLYELKGSQLSLPVHLSYNASGLKLEEISSWVGIGWSLNAGGVITRTVRGLRDEKPVNGYYYTGDLLYDDTADNWQNPTWEFVQKIENGEIDTDPDLFFFNFAGRAGKFVLGPEGVYGATGNAIAAIRTIPAKKLKINPEFWAGTISKWTVTTEDGTKYIFEDRETTTENVNPIGFPSPEEDRVYVSSWYLSQIISADDNDVINFEYSSYDATHDLRLYEEKFHFGVNPVNGEPCDPEDKKVEGTYTTQSKRLITISSTDQIIYFHSNLRSDGEYRLDSLRIESKQSDHIKTIAFDYTSRTDRLFLKSVEELSDGNSSLSAPYEFEYNDLTLPDLSSTSIDHWGYYNGRSNGASLIPRMPYRTSSGNIIYLSGAIREPNESKMKAGILEKISYPLGGWTDFVYEAHDYASVSGNTPQRKIKVSGNENLLATYDNDGPYEKTKEITIGGDPGSEVYVTVLVTFNPNVCNQSDECFVDFNGAYYTESGTYFTAVSPGTYTLRAQAPNQSGSSSSINVSWQEMYSFENLSGFSGLPAGGLRIKEIKNYDGLGNIHKKTFSYRLHSEEKDTVSSGVIVREPQYAYEIPPSSPQCRFLSRSSFSFRPLGITQGSSVGYKEVTVTNYGLNQLPAGKSRYYYRTAELASDYDTSLWPFSPVTSNDWQRGQLLKIDLFNDEEQLVQKTKTDYSFEQTDPVTSRDFRALSYKVVNNTSQITYQGVKSTYKVISGWVSKEKEITTKYDPNNGKEIISQEEIEYNSNNLLPSKTTETNSDSTKRITEFRYAHEITDDGTGVNYNPMEGLHMLSQPYSVAVKDSSGTVLSKRWTLWSDSTGWWRPRGEWIWEGGNPDSPVFEFNN